MGFHALACLHGQLLEGPSCEVVIISLWDWGFKFGKVFSEFGGPVGAGFGETQLMGDLGFEAMDLGFSYG